LAAVNPGDSIAGRYRLVERIGEGGMGIVWRAEQIALGRAVAIKVIHHDNATPEMRQRFQREAELAARMRHRHVIDIVEYGHTDDGDQYLVMPMLEGETLATRLARQPKPSVDDVLGGMRAILSGLAAIRDRGIVHRDLKPGNVFLAMDADGVLLKLLDFGISRTAGPRARNSLTQLGTAIGRAVHGARAIESARDVDHRADLYSAGVILYEALCGNPPFEGADPFAIYRAVLSSEPMRVAQRRPDLPVELSELVHRALARDPERRFSDAREMRDALDAIASISPHAARIRPRRSWCTRADGRQAEDREDGRDGDRPLTKAKPRTSRWTRRRARAPSTSRRRSRARACRDGAKPRSECRG
jgi:serine/threonine-protein kinase